MKNFDSWLMRSKDILLVAGCLWTLSVWGMGFINLPNRVKQIDMEETSLKEKVGAYHEANLLFHAGIGKDIDYIKLSILELKNILIEKPR